ncbi:hypothetical protein EUX98_g8337 [Antrodiella citrinella]|uniref:Uncharacterized protein n=1 Tax=Antrodiella citrinella TaxID=2447956 RepID=A0A4S4MAA5_9APHY|nr:hypothetical protein EUX98_g8337 [Antrodiella citrinella]
MCDVPSQVSCGDLVALDAYFKRFKSQSMTAQGRDMSVWAPFFEAAASTPAGTETSIDKAMEVALFRRPAQDVLDAIPNPTLLQLPEPIPYPHVETCKLDKCSCPPGTLYSKCSEHDFVAIKTAYDPEAPDNRREPYLTETDPGLPPDIRAKLWTSKEMRFAEDAAVPTDLEDLAQKLKTHFDENGMKQPKKYIRIHPELYAGKELMILDQDDKLIALIDGSISTHITRNLAARLKAALACSLKPEDEVRHRDSKKDEDRAFVALHFEIYARYCYKGDNFPVDVSPFLLVDEQNNPLPHTTLQPYESTDMVNRHQAFEELRAAWQMLFDHVRDKLYQHLPDEFEEVVAYANSLPHWTAPAAYPFSGFVVNLNVMTRSHRDTKDTSICLVLVLGEPEGGDLCLVEPGLTVKLREGDFIVFPSGKITHFNLHYVGVAKSVHVEPGLNARIRDNADQSYSTASESVAGGVSKGSGDGAVSGQQQNTQRTRLEFPIDDADPAETAVLGVKGETMYAESNGNVYWDLEGMGANQTKDQREAVMRAAGYSDHFMSGFARD